MFQKLKMKLFYINVIQHKYKSVELDYNLYKAKKLYVFLSDIVNHMQLLWLNFICYLHDAFIELPDRLTQ